MFEKKYRFRYGDIDKGGNIKISTIMDVMQDIAISHSASVGYGNAKLKEMNIAWLLEGWRVKLIAPLKDDAPADVKTGIMSLKACESMRFCEIWQNGEIKVKATADWFTVNTEKMRITRIPEECIDAYENVSEEDNGLPFERFKPEADAQIIDVRKVENRDLDMNFHLNNVKAIEIMLNYLPEDFSPTEFTVRYPKETKEGEGISVCRKDIDGGIYYEIRNSDNASCVLMKIF